MVVTTPRQVTTCPEKDERAGSVKRESSSRATTTACSGKAPAPWPTSTSKADDDLDDDDFDDDFDDDEEEDWDPDHQLNVAPQPIARRPARRRAQAARGDPATSASIS